MAETGSISDFIGVAIGMYVIWTSGRFYNQGKAQAQTEDLALAHMLTSAALSAFGLLLLWAAATDMRDNFLKLQFDAALSLIAPYIAVTVGLLFVLSAISLCRRRERFLTVRNAIVGSLILGVGAFDLARRFFFV